MLLPLEIVWKAALTEYLLHLLVEKILVCSQAFISGQNITHTLYSVWYGNHRNRGFISPKTLESLQDMPFIEERWKLLAEGLGSWRRQPAIVENS